MVRDFFDAYDKFADSAVGRTVYVDDDTQEEITEEEVLRKMVGIEVKKATDDLRATIEKMVAKQEPEPEPEPEPETENK